MTLIEMQERIRKIEVAIGQINLALGNLAPKRQLSHILTLLTKQITDLNTEISNIKSQLEVLKK